MEFISPGRRHTPAVSIKSITAEMIPDLVKLHREAFKGYINTRLGSGYIKAFISWFREAKQAIALAAIDSNGRPIGYVVGAPLGYSRAMNRHLFWVVSAAIVLRPWIFLNAQFRRNMIARVRTTVGSSSIRDVRPDLPEPTMSLVSIAVSPSAQGKKVGQCLLKAFEANARMLQMRSLRLSVYPDNTIARRLYERWGWQPFSKSVRAKTAIYYFRILDKKMAQN